MMRLAVREFPLWQNARSAVALATFTLALFGNLAWAEEASASRIPIVVELFTSEGCSSCPIADDLLRDLSRRQPLPGIQIVPLAYHVEYWNTLGWVDPFSTEDATRRQYDYSETRKATRVYTPQMIVAGGGDYVGNDRVRTMKDLIRESKREQATIEIDLDSETVSVSSLPDRSGGYELLLAIIESNLGGERIPSGENVGAELRHDGVVRRLERLGSIRSKTALPFERSFKLKLEPDWKRENIQVVAFVQAKPLSAIRGAAVVSLDRPAPEQPSSD